MNRFDAEPSKLQLSRRQLLIGGAGAAATFAFAPLDVMSSDKADDLIAERKFSPSVWYEIDADGQVNVNVARCEMGQHVGTALAQIVAEELGADWDLVNVRHVSSDPQWGFTMTGGSWSVFQMYQPLSQAGAAGRIALIETGAAILGVNPGNCEVIKGRVISGNASIGFGEVVSHGIRSRALSLGELAALPIKRPADRSIIGRDRVALDVPPKTNGSAVYGIDVEVDGMAFGRPVAPPTRYGSAVSSVDDSQCADVFGYLGYEVLEDLSGTMQGWVVVLATSYAEALEASGLIKISYQTSPTAGVNEADILQQGRRDVDDTDLGVVFVNDGEAGHLEENTARTVVGYYTTKTAMHFQMEPLSAVAELKDGIWHIHCGNQSHSLTVPLIAKALGVSSEEVYLHQYLLGGGFGRRAYADYALPAALAAKQFGRPVKVVFSRPDDALFDQARSPSVQRLTATLRDGGIAGWEHRFSAAWPTLAMAPGFMPEGLDGSGKFDPFSASGADHWYDIPNNRVVAVNNSLAQETFNPGWLRSVGPGWLAWGAESLLDEVAAELKQDPVDLRLSLLNGHGKNAGESPHATDGARRLHAVLLRCREQCGWGRNLPDGEGLGIATCFGQERTMPTWIACAAHVAVDSRSGRVTVKKIYMTIDAGTVVHPDSALAQIEGSILWGVSLALYEDTEIVNGAYGSQNFHNYSPLRMHQVPELDIEFIESTEFPVGLGEPGVIAVAPAIGNAVYAASGARVRDLPMTPQLVRDAIVIEETPREYAS